MKIIAIINQKGGVGKTTTTINLGAGLAQSNKKVLLIDIDPQSHLTQGLGIDSDSIVTNIYEVLRQRKTEKKKQFLEKAIIERDKLSVIPSTIELAGAEMELSGIPGREMLLKEALSQLTNYDYVLLDCPPSLGLLTLNALTTADELFIPVQTEFLALQGMSQLIDTIELVETRLNKGVAVTGVLATRYDRRKTLNRQAVEHLQNHFGERVFKTFIRENIALAEAPSHGQTIFEYQVNSHGAQDYLALTKEVLERT